MLSQKAKALDYAKKSGSFNRIKYVLAAVDDILRAD